MGLFDVFRSKRGLLQGADAIGMRTTIRLIAIREAGDYGRSMPDDIAAAIACKAFVSEFVRSSAAAQPDDRSLAVLVAAPAVMLEIMLSYSWRQTARRVFSTTDGRGAGWAGLMDQNAPVWVETYRKAFPHEWETIGASFLLWLQNDGAAADSV
ncbi:MAG: hypothetical protein O9333_14210 [Beijerinckiaceae bacterium]|jgi:hypothetical protein|nr:hypothetical protein [Beijerinckiaceae bacterium]